MTGLHNLLINSSVIPTCNTFCTSPFSVPHTHLDIREKPFCVGQTSFGMMQWLIKVILPGLVINTCKTLFSTRPLASFCSDTDKIYPKVTWIHANWTNFPTLLHFLWLPVVNSSWFHHNFRRLVQDICDPCCLAKSCSTHFKSPAHLMTAYGLWHLLRNLIFDTWETAGCRPWNSCCSIASAFDVEHWGFL